MISRLIMKSSSCTERRVSCHRACCYRHHVFWMFLLLVAIVAAGIDMRILPIQCKIFVSAQEQQENIQWTSSGDEDTQPALPLSMKQRKQLLQLQQTIEQSSNPQETLQQVAQANQMSTQDLMNIMNKNAQDLQQNPSLLETKTLPKTIFKIIGSFSILISRIVQQHPKTFTLSAILLLLTLYTMFVIPRTGLHISTQKGLLLSKGPTTFFIPSDKYLHKLILQQNQKNPPISVKTLKLDWEDLLSTGKDEEEEGGIIIHKLPRKHDLCQAMTAHYSLSPDELLEEFPSLVGETKDEIEKERESIVELLYKNGQSVIRERNLIEFSSTSSSIKESIRCIHKRQPEDYDDDSNSNDNQLGMFVVPGLGNLGRYGLIFWKVTNEITTKQSNEEYTSLTITTLKRMGFFDGQIHIVISQLPDNDGMIFIQISLAIPKGGRKISKRLGQDLVSEIGQSIKESTLRRTRQTLARKSQNKRYKESTKRRANERRQTRNQRERLLEEMAEDRRRRWQRSNPDAGRYRPSNIRQRSPNNC